MTSNPLHAADAASAQVLVTGNGQPLANAVVSLQSMTARSPVRTRNATSAMDQQNLQFAPHVLAIQAGTSVRFPNSDNIRHQVYSFSPAKRFDLPLYSGQPASPVRFDVPGVVELGCNIHDSMLGYIVVVDTPYFAVTDKDGKVDVPAPVGTYKMQVWHERQMAGPAHPTVRTIVVGTRGANERVEIDVQPVKSTQEPADERLRNLQERFRGLKRGG